MSEDPRPYGGRDDELEELLARWDAFAAAVRSRLAAGREHYGSAWRARGKDGNLREAGDEAADLAAYGFFAWLVAMSGADPADGRAELSCGPQGGG